MNKRNTSAQAFDPDVYIAPNRRYTDGPKPVKQLAPHTVSRHFPEVATRLRTKSFHNVSGSMDYSNISLVGIGQKTGTKTGKDHGTEGEDEETGLEGIIATRYRRNSGGEVASKRITELANPPVKSVYMKDLDLVDTKVKLAHLNVKWPDRSQPVERKQSKSTSRVRACSTPHHQSQHIPQRTRDVSAPRTLTDPMKEKRQNSVSKTKPNQRCLSEEKHRTKPVFTESADPRKAAVLKGPSACNLYLVDINLVRQYKEDQQHLLTIIKEMSIPKAERPSILRNHMQEYAPWAAYDFQASDGLSKEVHFL